MPGPVAYPALVIAPVGGLAVSCLAHVLAARLGAGPNKYAALRIGLAVGLIGTLIASMAAVRSLAASPTDAAALVLLNLLTYAALAFGYFNFVNLTIASLRIRMLEELKDAGGSVSAAELGATYGADAVIAIRLERLLRGGHLVEREGRLHTGRRPFVIIARLFDFLHWFIIRLGHGNRQ